MTQNRSDMDLLIIGMFFHIGKNFAVTPSALDNKEPSVWQRTYNFLVFCFFTVGSCASLYYKVPEYLEFNPIQLVLWVLTDVVRYTHNVYTLVVVMTLQREKWFKLVSLLKETAVGKSSPKSYYLTFILAQTSFLILITSMLYVCYVCYDLYTFLQFYFVEFLQFYSQFFFATFCCVVAKMVRARYRHQKMLLSRVLNSSASPNAAKTVQKKILLLKETVNCFNDIFGGTILLNILFSSLKSIIYLDRIVKSQDVSADHTSGFFVLLHFTQIGVIVIMWVSKMIKWSKPF
jgi:hypothetical protein